MSVEEIEAKRIVRCDFCQKHLTADDTEWSMRGNLQIRRHKVGQNGMAGDPDPVPAMDFCNAHLAMVIEGLATLKARGAIVSQTRVRDAVRAAIASFEKDPKLGELLTTMDEDAYEKLADAAIDAASEKLRGETKAPEAT